jgi:hypothetical protein
MPTFFEELSDLYREWCLTDRLPKRHVSMHVAIPEYYKVNPSAHVAVLDLPRKLGFA